MRRLLLCFAAAVALAGAPASKPKLVLAVVIDQFRYDYLTRFQAEYSGGFRRLLDKGAVFTDAHYIHFPTVTAVGHATVLSGATPSVSGIVANEWFETETGARVTSVSDSSVRLLGGAAGRAGSSPSRLLVSTIGDELKMAGKGGKVIGLSFKDRSAILPGGHTADAAYWFDDITGNWVSSTYYFGDLPAWVKEINQARPADQFAGKSWLPVGAAAGAQPLLKMPAAPGASFYRSVEATPFSNEMLEALTERCITAEQLGRHPGVDVLAVSFSGNDYVGHAYGPDSPQVRDISIRTDRLLGKLFTWLDGQIGAGNYLVVLTADHGVSPKPEENIKRHMPAGRLDTKAAIQAMDAVVSQKFGEGKWILGASAGEFFLDHRLLHAKKVDAADAAHIAADVLRAVPHVARVYTGDDIANGRVQHDDISQALSYGYNRQRSGDVLAVPENYWFFAEGDPPIATTHGTPFNYDNHVPVIFFGAGIAPAHYHRRIAVNDIAPTLAAILEIEEPSGSMGHVLEELWGK